jgi:hypothetical protein
MRPFRERNHFIAAILFLAIGCASVWPDRLAVAQSNAAKSNPPELDHALKGMEFVGRLTVEGETVPPDDVLSFQDGVFSSQTCLGFGFEPAPYWVRQDDDGIHFRSELKSPEHGTIEFQGVFDGERMVATAVWIKERWYWTIEQELQFTGRPSDQAK